jgi:hypothetical protein
MAATLLARPDFLYGATGGKQGLPSAQRNVSFPDGGYFVQRSGWGEGRTPFQQERFLIFDCGPLGDGGHGHYDALSVEIAASGRPLVMDPGRYTYAEDAPNWRRWFKATSAHNTVCIDGLDQTPYKRGKPKGATAQARLLERVSSPGLDILRGEVVSPVYEAVHTRDILFVADEYWLIIDRLRGTQPHRYDLRFHLAPEAWGATTITRTLDNAIVRAPGFALVFPGSFEPRVEAGWIAPRYGEKRQAPVVSVVADEVAEAEFITLVAPLEENAAVPTLHVRATSAETMSLEVRGVGSGGTARHRIAWTISGQHREYVWDSGRL